MNAATSSKSFEVSVETAAGLERRMTVRVPAADIHREVEARLAKVGRTAKLKGFRPGKIPHKVVRKYYGGQVRDEVLSDVIRSSYSHAIAEQKLNPAGGPRIEPLTDDAAAEHFSYRAVFEVYPEIQLQPLGDISIERPVVEINDGDVEIMIDKLREQRGEWQSADRKAATGDRVVVDFAGKIDGESFPGGEGKQVTIVIGSGQVLADFDNALQGVGAGEAATAKVEFPKDYPAQMLAGKKAVFDITAHRVEERILPAVDEAFAATFGVTEGGVAALQAEVRTNMERELAERIKSETKTRTFDALIRANNVAVPRSLVEQEITSLQADSMRQMGVQDPKQAPARERFTQLAERRVTVGLLIQELMKQHPIKLDQARVDRRIQELAAPYEKPEEAAQFYRSNRGMMAQVEAAVLEDQVADFLLANAKTKENKLGFREFMGA
jgi:trigger factor